MVRVLARSLVGVALLGLGAAGGAALAARPDTTARSEGGVGPHGACRDPDRDQASDGARLPQAQAPPLSLGDCSADTIGRLGRPDCDPGPGTYAGDAPGRTGCAAPAARDPASGSGGKRGDDEGEHAENWSSGFGRVRVRPRAMAVEAREVMRLGAISGPHAGRVIPVQDAADCGPGAAV